MTVYLNHLVILSGFQRVNSSVFVSGVTCYSTFLVSKYPSEDNAAGPQTHVKCRTLDLSASTIAFGVLYAQYVHTGLV